MSTSREKHELILSSLLSPPADIPKPPVSLQTSGSFLPTAGSTLIMLKDSSMLGSKSAEKIGSKEKKESEISSKTSDELKKELIEKINTALDNIGTEAKIPPAHSKNPAFAKTYLADAIANLRVYDDLLEEVYAGGGTIQSEYKEIRLPKPETKEAKQRDEKDKPKEPSNELTQVYYRDSTKLKIRTQKSKERFDGANYAIMAFNYLDASISLLRAEGVELSDKDLQEIRKEAKDFFEKIQTGAADPSDERARFLHQKIIPRLTTKLNISKKEALKRLEKIINFSNFDQPNCSMATKFKIGDRTFLHMDVPMSGEIPDQIKEQLKIIKEQSLDKTTVLGIPWFDGLELDIKKQVKLHAQDILDGRMISTRLLDMIPGVRFGGEDIIYDISNPNDKNPPIVSRGFHSGNPAHNIKNKSKTIEKAIKSKKKEITELKKSEDKDSKESSEIELAKLEKKLSELTKLTTIDPNLEATRQSLDQYKKLTGKNNIIVMSLTTPSVLFEGHLEQQTVDIISEREAKGDFSIAWVNAPAHGTRRLFGMELDGAERVLNIANSLLSEMKNGDLLSKHEELKETEISQDQASLSNALRRFEVLRNRTFEPNENDSLEIANQLNKIVQIVNKYKDYNSQYRGEDFALINVCKSGKDRTGLQRIFNFISDITDYIKIKENSSTMLLNGKQVPIEKAVRQVVTRVSPPDNQAGGPGGTLGSGGIMTSIEGTKGIVDISSAVPKNWKKDGYTTDISRKTANMRKDLPENPDARFWQRPRLWKTLATVGLGLLGVGLCATGIGSFIGIPALLGSAFIITAGAGAATLGLAKFNQTKNGLVKAGAFLLGGLGVALCFSGVGAIFGLPLIAGALTLGLGQGISMFAGTGLFLKGCADLVTKTGVGGKLYALGEIVLGFALAASGLGALGVIVAKVGALLPISGIGQAAATLGANIATFVTSTFAPAMTVAVSGIAGAHSISKLTGLNLMGSKIWSKLTDYFSSIPAYVASVFGRQERTQSQSESYSKQNSEKQSYEEAPGTKNDLDTDEPSVEQEQKFGPPGVSTAGMGVLVAHHDIDNEFTNPNPSKPGESVSFASPTTVEPTTTPPKPTPTEEAPKSRSFGKTSS